VSLGTAGAPLVIHNARAITPQGVLQPGCVVIERGTISALYAGEPPPGGNRLDAGGLFVAPGLIDMHVHGGSGADFMDGTPEAFDTVCRFYARHGVTALQATTVAAPLEDILRVLRTARQWKGSRPPGYPGAQLLGVHVEGPFLNVEQKGAHRADHVRPPSPAELERLLEVADVITEVTLAPELPGALEVIRALTERGILVAAGHSQAREPDVVAGLRHVTHIYSAMSTVVRQGPWRVPGLLETALASDALSTEMIGDGRHLPPTLMRLVLKCKLPDRVCLVSDAMSGAGMPEGGTFWLAGQQVIVEDGVAMLADRSQLRGGAQPQLLGCQRGYRGDQILLILIPAGDDRVDAQSFAGHGFLLSVMCHSLIPPPPSPKGRRGRRNSFVGFRRRSRRKPTCRDSPLPRGEGPGVRDGSARRTLLS